MKYTKTALLVATASMAAAFAGCGGGNGGGIFNPTATPNPTTTATPTATAQSTQRFAGNYTGAYATIGSLAGDDLSGTFTATASSTGQITGNIKQDNGLTTTASGTVNSAGVINVTANGSVVINPAKALTRGDERAVVAPTATPQPTATSGPITITYSTKLDGTATIVNNDSVMVGTVLTTQSNGNNPRGRFVGIRNAMVASPYAGTYSGSSNGTITSTGTTIPATFTFTVSTNGLIRGTYTRTTPGVRARPLIGTIDSSGNAYLVALAEEENPVGSGTFTLVVSNFTGKGTTSGTVKISGTLNRTGTSAVAATGTFTATRTSTATQ